MWKPVVGYEGLYEISSLGRVKALPKDVIDSMGRYTRRDERFLKVNISKRTGYPFVGLYKNGKQHTVCIHRLIAEAFIPNPNHFPCINHIDENRANSVLGNLEWCTYKYNNNYGHARENRAYSQKKYYEKNGSPNKGHRGGFAVIQYDLKGNMIARYEKGLPEIEELKGKRLPSLSSCLCHKNKSAYGYVWKYEGVPFSYDPKRSNEGKKFPNVVKSHQKQVIKKDLLGNILATYNSVSKAAKANNFERHALSRKKKGEYRIGDYIYVVEKKEHEYIPTGHKGPRYDLRGRGKPILQLDMQNNILKRFNCIADAAREIGDVKFAPDITNACRGNLKTAHGYKWRYA